MAMYKTKNTGTRNGTRGTRVIGGMSPNIPGNVAKYSGECHQTFPEISSKIPRNAHNGLAFKFNGRAPKHWTQFY